MSTLGLACQVARNFAGSARLSAERRHRWEDRLRAVAATYWPELGRQPDVGVESRLRPSNGGWLVRGSIGAGRERRPFWLRWCPEADPEALLQTAEHMTWWRKHHSSLENSVADVFDHWPDESVLVLEGAAGIPLDRRLRRVQPATHAYHELLGAFAGAGRWLRSYRCAPIDLAHAPQSLVGSEVQRTADRQLVVNARRLLEGRIERAEEAVHALLRAGFTAARSWSARLDLDEAVRKVTTPPPAGFIHGDFKPGNVLADGNRITVIDWWTAPRVSWPVQDVATFASHLWLAATPAAAGVWFAFADRYYPHGLDDDEVHIVNVLGTMLCLSNLARRASRAGRILFDAGGIDAALQRLSAPRVGLGSFLMNGVVSHAADDQ